MTANSTAHLRILVVDDQPTILMAYRMALSNAETEIVAVSDGQEALKQVRHQQFNLVVLDVDMPGMNGFEVCRRLKEDAGTRHLPVIFVTGNVRTVDERQGLAMGAAHYLTKPFDLNTLRSAIRRCAIC